MNKFAQDVQAAVMQKLAISLGAISRALANRGAKLQQGLADPSQSSEAVSNLFSKTQDQTRSILKRLQQHAKSDFNVQKLIGRAPSDVVDGAQELASTRGKLTDKLMGAGFQGNPLEFSKQLQTQAGEQFRDPTLMEKLKGFLETNAPRLGVKAPDLSMRNAPHQWNTNLGDTMNEHVFRPRMVGGRLVNQVGE